TDSSHLDLAQFIISLYYNQADFQLNSLSVTVTMPTGYDRTFTDFTPPVLDFGVLAYLPVGSESPGALAELVAPEPASFALLALGGVLVSVRGGRGVKNA